MHRDNRRQPTERPCCFSVSSPAHPPPTGELLTASTSSKRSYDSAAITRKGNCWKPNICISSHAKNCYRRGNSKCSGAAYAIGVDNACTSTKVQLKASVRHRSKLCRCLSLRRRPCRPVEVCRRGFSRTQ